MLCLKDSAHRDIALDKRIASIRVQLCITTPTAMAGSPHAVPPNAIIEMLGAACTTSFHAHLRRLQVALRAGTERLWESTAST